MDEERMDEERMDPHVRAKAYRWMLIYCLAMLCWGADLFWAHVVKPSL